MGEKGAGRAGGGAGRAPAMLDEAVLVGGTLAYGLVLQRVIPDRWHVPANVAAVLASAAVARGAGASFADCGLSRDALRPSLSAGAAAAAVIGAGVMLAALPGRTRGLFSDDRVTGHGGKRAVYEALVRIPAGTALSEEVLFRGVMLGVMLRRHSVPVAVARSSLCFGVWHVLPAMASLRGAAIHRGVSGRAGAAAAVTGVVAMTAAAGAGLAVLRLRAGGVAAPVLAHAALNATAYLVARRTGRRPRDEALGAVRWSGVLGEAGGPAVLTYGATPSRPRGPARGGGLAGLEPLPPVEF